MGSIPQELSLDFKTKFIPQTITDFLKKLSTIYNVSERSSKLNDYINSLEDEMRKIDAFKRELPLCMLLLTDAIVFLKDESRMQYTAANAKPVLEEFIPLKKDDCNDEEEEENEDEVEDCRDKKNWMSSVQLWNSDDHSTTINYNSKVEIKQVEEEVNRYAIKDPFHSNKDKGEEKTFIPFKGYPTFLNTVVVRREDRKVLSVPGLSLLTPGIKNLKEESSSSHSKPSCSKVASSPISKVQSNLRTGAQQPQHTSRKQRRCWSQELHRRFVNALQQLGGSQVATPKQIRELMQVDGLTNDEVKSHLQKYRLHGRRLPTGAPASSTNPSVVVLGGLWTPQDQFSESSKQSNSQSGSPQGPLQLAGNTGGTSTTGDNSMDDDDEDEKSDSYSWRSHIHKPRRNAV